jgi:ABC-type iron transport system FetAB permease component
VAVGRGIVQLALVSLLLGFALTQPWASVVILTVMVITAILTSTGRPAGYETFATLSGRSLQQSLPVRSSP